jgi:hypothetical protein
MVCSYQMGGHTFLTGAAPSHHAAVGGAAFSGDVKPPGLNFLRGVDRPGTCETESYMEKLNFIRACLSDVRVMMAIMCAPLVEFLCQMVMGRIPGLEYLLPDVREACGHVLSCETVNAVAS